MVKLLLWNCIITQHPISFLEEEFILSLDSFLLYILFLIKNVTVENLIFFCFPIRKSEKWNLTIFPVAFFAAVLANGELL